MVFFYLGYGEKGRGSIFGLVVLVFDIYVIDFYNFLDFISIIFYYKFLDCLVLSKKGDYFKYYYNVLFLDGILLDFMWNLGKMYNIVLGFG